MRMLVLVITVAVAAPALASQRVPGGNRGSCYLYEHRDMQGARVRLANGDYDNFSSPELGSSNRRDLPDWNDAVSSATVDRGCRLTVWEHSEQSGDSKGWDGGPNGWRVNYVGDRWNDRISSATCVCN